MQAHSPSPSLCILVTFNLILPLVLPCVLHSHSLPSLPSPPSPSLLPSPPLLSLPSPPLPPSLPSPPSSPSPPSPPLPLPPSSPSPLLPPSLPPLLSQSPYSLVIRDSDLDDACQSLELFLESYWAATRSVTLTPSPLTHHH